MQCPNDQSMLVMSERSGIEIDFCPTCRGVWLDRGELDKIVDRATQETGQPSYRNHHQGSSRERPYRRKSSWLGELFD